MLITRNAINSNIQFTDIRVSNSATFTYKQLCNGIDIIKDKLKNEHNCRPGDSVLIGIRPSTLQIATFFACAELGLEVVILDHGRNDNWISTDYVDPKTQSLMPITFFILDSRYHTTKSLKEHFFMKICEHFVVVDFDTLYKEYDKENLGIEASDNSVLIKCTSSGTTGTAKIVKHTHDFLYHLIQRNTKFYDDTVCMMMNLNHGSSPATYFLPALCSKNTTKFISSLILRNAEDENKHPMHQAKQQQMDFNHLVKTVKSLDVKHLMIPYSHMIDQFLKLNDYPNLNVYTLSTIQYSWLELYKNKKINNIISFFGCNETSGPLLINEINDPDFSESGYKLMDDFYKLNLNDGANLEVEMPVYNTKISTNDMFDFVNGKYLHKGRNDLYRVNGYVVDLPRYNKEVNEILDGMVIVDTSKDKLYIAVWDNISDCESKINMIANKFDSLSDGAHKIDKHAVLEKDRFYSGVKLDMELLRDYFRKFVKQ